MPDVAWVTRPETLGLGACGNKQRARKSLAQEDVPTASRRAVDDPSGTSTDPVAVRSECNEKRQSSQPNARVGDAFESEIVCRRAM